MSESLRRLKRRLGAGSEADPESQLQLQPTRRLRVLHGEKGQLSPSAASSGQVDLHTEPFPADIGPSTIPVARSLSDSTSSLSTLDTSVNLAQRGVTYNISGSANQVHLHNGAVLGQPSLATTWNAALRGMQRSRNAEYDITENASRGPCTPQTRTGLLQDLEEWSRSGSVRLYWLNGIAGTGKTTISYSLCDRLKARKRLGASFFCSHSLQDCRDINLVIPSVAHQLGLRYLPFRDQLIRVLETDPDIYRKSLESQLRGLIIEPWESCENQLPKDVVIILDALDECEEGHISFLQALFNNIGDMPFKILITSRPDYPIHDFMKKSNPKLLSTFILHDMDKDIVEADIARYLSYTLSSHIPEDVLCSLRRLSGSLFIFAATLARLFDGGNFDARARLQLLETSVSTQRKVFASLDEFYQGVLSSALEGGKMMDEEVQGIKDLLFTVVCARDPLTRGGLAGILNVTVAEVDRRLDSLHSVFSIPCDPDHPIVIFHVSFADFIQESGRSGRFHCNSKTFHSKLAKRCLTILNQGLGCYPCGMIGLPFGNWIDLEAIRDSMAPSFRYSVIRWVEHWFLSEDSLHHEVLSAVEDFMSTYILHWVECLGLLSSLAIAVRGLETILNAIDKETTFATVMYDFLRLIQYYYEAVQHNTMDALPSILIWMPSSSSLRDYYPHLFRNLPRVLCGLPSVWTGPERLITIHTDAVLSIALSYDGRRLVSGGKDNVVRLWDLHEQVQERTLKGHRGWIRSVALTQDGRRVVSGSHDKSIRFWDIPTRKGFVTLKSSKMVLAVAISSDEKWIASSDAGGHVRIFDAVNGELVHSLTGHAVDWIRSITFTSTSAHLISGSDDMTARVWSVRSGTELSVLMHSSHVLCVASSSITEDRIATGSGDQTVRLWDLSGREIQVFRGHSNTVTAVAFTKDGQQLISGSSDGTLRIWSIASGNSIHTFSEAGNVQSLAIFPDGLKIASCSDNEIAIWSMRSVHSFANRGVTAGTRSPAVRAASVSFSSDGEWVLLLPSLQILCTASLSEKISLPSPLPEIGHACAAFSTSRTKVAITDQKGRKIEIWELTSDRKGIANHLKLGRHANTIRSLSFSQDETQLVSTSDDHTAQVWSMLTGKRLLRLVHRAVVYHATFSHDDKLIASTSNNIVYIWNAHTGKRIRRFDAPCQSVTFTPDDEHIITSWYTTITIFDAVTYSRMYDYTGYHYWTTLEDGTSYALRNDNWVYRIPRLGHHPNLKPHKLFWIPTQYQPNLATNHTPLFTIFSEGVRACLPRNDRLITLVIPAA